MDVIFSAFASSGMCLPSRCLAMGIHVTLSSVFPNMSINFPYDRFPVYISFSSATCPVHFTFLIDRHYLIDRSSLYIETVYLELILLYFKGSYVL
jgi:hypothetical protein